MKKFLSVMLALAMAMSLAACGGSSSSSDNSGSSDSQGSDASGNKVVKIGVFEPQTGDNGAGGKQEILGMQYANYVQPTARPMMSSWRSWITAPPLRMAPPQLLNW